jgi:uncharacterized protein (TIGR02246 family)
MINLRNLVVLTASLMALTACTKTAPDTAADVTALGTVEAAWYKAYNAGDGVAVAALYADDAVLNAPGSPAVRGKAAIGEYYAKDAPKFAADGLTDGDGPTSDAGVSGDLAWRWGTFTVTDKSGATVETGKYITVFQRKDGKWIILRDTWNSDDALATTAAATVSVEPTK